MTDNIRPRADEQVKNGMVLAADAYPYARFTGDPQREVLLFMLVDDMPTIVTAIHEKDGSALLQYHGFWGGAWYTDFTTVTDGSNREVLAVAAMQLIEKAEDMLLNDLHEPKSATVEPEAQEEK